MKGMIFEIKRFAVHDGDGIRTTVFFKGCPLSCVWCHNPEGISFPPLLAFYAHKCVNCGTCVAACPVGAHKMADGRHWLDHSTCTVCGKCPSVCPADALTLYGKEIAVDELLHVLLEDKEFYETSSGGVTLSGGECLMQADFCAELLQKLKQNGIHTAVDTCGFVSKKALDKVIPYTDVFLYDVKAYHEDVHIRCTGQSNQIILENLHYLDAAGKQIEIRIPYVPEYNDTEIEAIAHFLAKLQHITKIRVLAYHNYAASKYRALEIQDKLPTRLPTDEELESARELLRTVTGHKILS